jgi:hypothetical protein
LVVISHVMSFNGFQDMSYRLFPKKLKTVKSLKVVLN